MRFLCLVSVPPFCILEYLSLFVLIIGSCIGAHLKCRMVSEHYVFLPQKTFLFLCIARQNLLAVRPASFQECELFHRKWAWGLTVSPFWEIDSYVVLKYSLNPLTGVHFSLAPPCGHLVWIFWVSYFILHSIETVLFIQIALKTSLSDCKNKMLVSVVTYKWTLSSNVMHRGFWYPPPRYQWL